jgi:hypothetical protein
VKVLPGMTVVRLAQLKPGDLFLSPAESGSFVGMVVHDPTLDGDRIILSLGPTFPPGTNCPSIVPAPHATVISFGSDFQLRLPVKWTLGRPSRPPSSARVSLSPMGSHISGQISHLL